ncbi:hypothetical protein ACQPW3_21695 [Actinosynnema sp. CA-248983]
MLVVAAAVGRESGVGQVLVDAAQHHLVVGRRAEREVLLVPRHVREIAAQHEELQVARPRADHGVHDPHVDVLPAQPLRQPVAHHHAGHRVARAHAQPHQVRHHGVRVRGHHQQRPVREVQVPNQVQAR